MIIHIRSNFTLIAAHIQYMHIQQCITQNVNVKLEYNPLAWRSVALSSVFTESNFLRLITQKDNVRKRLFMAT